MQLIRDCDGEARPMDFDERLIERDQVNAAIRRYCHDRPQHHAARSAFLLWRGEKLPAKYILRLSFEIATGCWPNAETLTGGKAGVRVLTSLGFDAIYEKPKRKSWNRSAVKCARRAALKDILERNYGRIQIEWKCKIAVPDLVERTSMQAALQQILNAIEAHRSIVVHGRNGHLLAFDLFLEEVDLPIKYDERQHFTPLRAASLRAYPRRACLGFDRARWIRLCDEIRAGDNSPRYRDEQRAFDDSVRDILAPRLGLLPVVRIFEEDVVWEKDGCNSTAAKQILAAIDAMIK
jgi:hypothetical protein